MIGCKYCRMEDDNEDFWADLEPLILVDEIGRGFDAKGACKETYHDPAFDVICTYSITIYNNRLQLAIGDALEIERKIKFCPMCGRKLKDD